LGGFLITPHKKIYYLCGLPRAGNTLFSSIINQNPDISVTANSVVCDIFCGTVLIKNTDLYCNYPDEQSLLNVTNNVIQNYYSDWESKYIVDRGVWGLPNNFEVLKKYAPNDIKIIVLVRDIKEILASFIKFSYSTKNNYIAQQGKTLEERCAFVMSNDGTLHRWLQAVFNITRPQHRKYIHLIEYNDLVSNMEGEIDKVYDYLDIPKFKHEFTNLSQLSNNGLSYNDKSIGGELHTIKTDKVEKNEYDINQYLPDNTDTLYKTDPFWRIECPI